MKVLLLEDVDNLGLAGDVKDVANGYGRNYLLPQEMAVLATKSALKQAEAVRKAGESKRAREKADADAIAGQINGTVLVFERRAGDQDKLYGSVTVAEIAQALNEKYELKIDKRKIALPEPIRALGEWDIPIKLMIEVTAQIKVVVINEGETYNPAKAEAETEEAVTEEVVAEEVVAEEVVAEETVEVETEVVETEEEAPADEDE